MLEIYSQNITVPQNVAIPFNSTSISKGCTAVKSAADTIELNKCGVYAVEFDGVASGTGNIVIQLQKNGVLQPQALTANTSTGTSDVEAMSFYTLVQVADSNSSCPCSSPTILRFINTGVSAQYVQANVIITKLC
jgi:hypothetical protein